MKLGAVAAGLVLVLGGVAGCSDGPATEAKDAPSVGEFCDALVTFRDTVRTLDSSDVAGYADQLQEAADALDRIGTPEDIPDDARAGFVLTITQIDDLPPNATQDDTAKLGDVDDADRHTLEALENYIQSSCPKLTGITSPADPESPSS